MLFASLAETLFGTFNKKINLYFFSYPIRFFLEIVLVTFLLNVPNNVSAKEANNKTIKIFIKLFVIKIVANNFLGFCNKFSTIFSSFLFLESSFKSVFESEKKATSVPEINAEQISKTSNAKALNVVRKSIEAKNKNSGSGPKCCNYKLLKR